MSDIETPTTDAATEEMIDMAFAAYRQSCANGSSEVGAWGAAHHVLEGLGVNNPTRYRIVHAAYERSLHEDRLAYLRDEATEVYSEALGAGRSQIRAALMAYQAILDSFGKPNDALQIVIEIAGETTRGAK